MCYFGKSNFASDALFDGCMDELKIFDRGLSEAEIQTEMNAIRPLLTVEVPVDPVTLPTGRSQKYY